MSQQFDFLNTGNTGVTFGNEEVPSVTDELLQEQRLEAQELLPSIKVILDTLDTEIAAVADLRAYMKELGPRPTAAVITAEYRARELFIDMVQRLKINIANRVADHEGQL